MWGQLALPPLAKPIARGATPQLTPRILKPEADESGAGAAAAGDGADAGSTDATGQAAHRPPTEAERQKAVAAARAAARKAAKARAAARRKRAAKVVPLKAIRVAPDTIHGTPPRADFPLLAVFARIRQIASVGEVRYLRPWLSRRTLRLVARNYGDSYVIPVAPRTLWQRISGEVLGIEYAGSRAIVTLKRPLGTDHLTFYVERGTWRLELTADGEAPGPAPRRPEISLREATHGIPGRGPLVAVMQTSAGSFRCRLEEGRAPETVAQFVGLARGKLGPVQAGGRVRRFYDGLRFHAGSPGKFIQSGDPTGTGSGGAGRTIRDEFDPKLRHDRPGILALASAGPHTGSSQFYVTLVPAPRFDDHDAVFGLCRDLGVVRRISEAPPNTVTLEKVIIQRGY